MLLSHIYFEYNKRSCSGQKVLVIPISPRDWTVTALRQAPCLTRGLPTAEGGAEKTPLKESIRQNACGPAHNSSPVECCFPTAIRAPLQVGKEPNKEPGTRRLEQEKRGQPPTDRVPGHPCWVGHSKRLMTFRHAGLRRVAQMKQEAAPPRSP